MYICIYIYVCVIQLSVIPFLIYNIYNIKCIMCIYIYAI